jgi:hypothetical protein
VLAGIRLRGRKKQREAGINRLLVSVEKAPEGRE